MELSLFAALGAGFLATSIMSLFLEVAIFNGWSQMPSWQLVLGAVFTGQRDDAMRLGSMVHFAVLGTFFFGTGYAVVLSGFDMPTIWIGAACGLVHGTLVGIVLGTLGDIHPRTIEWATAGVPGPNHGYVAGKDGIQISSPGIFGVNWGELTPAVIVIAHGLYGVVLAAIYLALA